MIEELKRCYRCKRSRPLSNFSMPAGSRDLSARNVTCDDCLTGKYKPTKPDYAANRKYRRYGIDSEAYQIRYDRQDGRCAICGDFSHINKRLSIDHDKETLIVRDLLCDRCNIGLGMFRHDPDLLVAASHYLQCHQRKGNAA